MNVNYSERSEVCRDYTLKLDVCEYVEWLDGDTPTTENLNQYISDEVLPYAQFDREDEYTIESGTDPDDLDEFLCYVKEYLEDNGDIDE